MKTTIPSELSNGTVRIPKALKTSDNCMALPMGNTYTFGNGVTYSEGDTLVVDLDQCPKHGDIVVMGCYDRKPFARLCEIAPLESDKRENWLMGTPDGELIVFLKLGKYDYVGVVTGSIPAGTPQP